MHMTVKHSYLIHVANILTHPERIFGGTCKGSIAYKMYLNRNVAKTYWDGFMQAFPVDPKWDEYVQKHDGVYAEEKVVTQNDLANLPEKKRADITAKIAEIDAEYKDVIEHEQAMEIERRKMLDEEVEVDLYTVAPDDVEISGPDGWKLWTILFNDGNGFIRPNETVTEG